MTEPSAIPPLVIDPALETITVQNDTPVPAPALAPASATASIDVEMKDDIAPAVRIHPKLQLLPPHR
jgi:hypothetical protein